jgi:hypothetical protein
MKEAWKVIEWWWINRDCMRIIKSKGASLRMERTRKD